MAMLAECALVKLGAGGVEIKKQLENRKLWHPSFGLRQFLVHSPGNHLGIT